MNVVFRHNIPHILFNNNKISIRRDYWKIFTIYQEFEERQQKNLINIINNIINKNIIGIKTCFYRIWSSFIYVEHFSVDFHLTVIIRNILVNRKGIEKKKIKKLRRKKK